MADNQLAGTGHGAQLWLSTTQLAAGLIQMKQITGYGIPKAVREFIETSHLESEAKEFAPTLPDPEEFSATANYRPGSDTDLAFQAAADDPNPRLVELRIPIRKTLVRKVTFLAYVSYSPAEDITLGDKMESEIMFRPTGPITFAAIP